MNTLAYFTNTLSPEIVDFAFGSFHFAIRWYSLFFALTFVVGYMILKKMFARDNRPPGDVDKLVVSIMLGTIIGARLGHCFFYAPGYYLSHPIEILQVWHGGLASHGGVIGILTAIYIFVRKNKQYSFLWVVDRVVIPVALGGLFIRTGNFFNSEIVGRPTDMPWGVIFTHIDTVTRHPAQLYEAICYFLIFLLLGGIYLKKQFPEGWLFGLFMVLVFTCRFVLEFLKEYQESFEATLPIDMGQILSIPCIIAGICLLIYAKKNGIMKKV